MFQRYWLTDVFRAEDGGEGTGASGGAAPESATTDAAPSAAPSPRGYDKHDDGLDATAYNDDSPDVKAPQKDAEDAGSDPPDADHEPEKAVIEDTAEKPAKALSEDLLERARDLGMTFEDVRHYRKDSTLRTELDRLEATKTAWDAKAPKADKPPEQQQGPDFDKLLVELEAKIKAKEGVYDEDQIALDRAQLEFLKLQNDRQKAIEKENQELKQFTADQKTQAQQRAFNEHIERVEGCFAALGSEYEPLFGKGSIDKLAVDSPERANRIATNQVMDVMALGYQQAGLPIPDVKDLHAMAVGAKFATHTQQMARAKLKEDMKAASSQALIRSRPAGHKPLGGMEKVEAKFESYYADSR